MQIPYYIYAILICLITGVMNYQVIRRSALAGFIPFILLTLLVEIVAVYFKYNLDKSNAWLYNGYLVIQVAFFAWLFHKNIEDRKLRKIIAFVSFVYLVAVGVNYVFLSSILEFNPKVFVSGGIIIAVFSIFFLLHFFSLDDISREDKLYPMIYVTIGILGYFSVCSLTITLYKYLRIYNMEVGGTKVYNLVPRLLSLFMYLLFSYSLYACRRIKLTY